MRKFETYRTGSKRINVISEKYFTACNNFFLLFLFFHEYFQMKVTRRKKGKEKKRNKNVKYRTSNKIMNNRLMEKQMDILWIKFSYIT